MQIFEGAEVGLFVVTEGAVPGADFYALAGVAAGVVGGALAHNFVEVAALGFFNADPLGFDPIEVGGIDVGGEPSVEAVHLVWANEMHFAGQHGVVSGGGDVVGKSGLIGGQQRAVVPSADGGGMAAGHHAGAARRAQRKGRVGRIKAHPGGGQAIEVGRLDDGVAVGAGEGGDHLVGDDEEDVGFLVHGVGEHRNYRV